MVDFSTSREMAAYTADPKAMPAGGAGKRGYLRLGFELDSSGRSIMRDWERRAPIIVQQALYFDESMPEMPCVYILSSGGPNVDGDRYEQHFTVHKDAFAHISTGAATKLAEMHYNYSAMVQTFTLEDGAYLEYLPEAVIPCRHTRFISDTEITVAESATLFYSEIYASGRKYHDSERFEYDVLSVCARVRRPDGRLAYREKFVVEPYDYMPSGAGSMNGSDVIGNVIVVTPAESADAIYERTEAFFDSEVGVAAGIARLPEGAGLLYRVTAPETAPVKRLIREFCSTVRQTVKNKPLPEEFPWR